MANENGLTKLWLQKYINQDNKTYYGTPELNEQLYIHNKGFSKIQNLEDFTGLKVLYFEGNGCTKIENLDFLINLSCLYLQQNYIKKIENLDKLQFLTSLNLEDNLIEKVEGIQNNKQLTYLNLKRNKIGLQGLIDLQGLQGCSTITSLDLSENQISDALFVQFVGEILPEMAVLYFQGNPANKKIEQYRKTIIIKLKNLKYLDDRPIFEDERLFCEAFGRGGIEEERKERKSYKQKQSENANNNHDLMGKRFEEAQNLLAQQINLNSSNQSSFDFNYEALNNQQSNSTYNTNQLESSNYNTNQSEQQNSDFTDLQENSNTESQISKDSQNQSDKEEQNLDKRVQNIIINNQNLLNQLD